MDHDDSPIIGKDVPDERSLRSPRPVRDLDEFLAFLADLDEVFGTVESSREPTTGARFAL